MFKNRLEAAKQLEQKLDRYKNAANTVVLGLPRGGVVLSAEIGKYLNIPADIIVPRKIGAPNMPELAAGAITEDGSMVLNDEVVFELGIPKKYLDTEAKKEKKEAERRLSLYRGGRPPLELAGKTAIIVDDGVATGSTMIAAIRSARNKKASKIIAAIPVISAGTVEKIKKEVDEIICLDMPKDMYAVGEFYEYFPQVEDEEVVKLMLQK